jgi:chorismate dehydratase
MPTTRESQDVAEQGRGPIRLGAVSYLNTGPLVYGLDAQAERFQVRFDVPSRCATLLHENEVDLGLIPSIEYLHGPGYRIVPGVAIVSDGPVASVALFSRKPVREIKSIALDLSSRTSVALLRILCARWFEIEPALTPMAPDMTAMLEACDAALVIGDIALFADHERLGLEKVDLAEEWVGMTGLPFVFAFWAGRSGIATAADVAALNVARDRGIADPEGVAERYFPGDSAKILRGAEYLRENVKYAFGEREQAGLRMFYTLAAALGIVPAVRELAFFGGQG